MPAPSSRGGGGQLRGRLGRKKDLHMAESVGGLNQQLGDMGAKCKGKSASALMGTAKTLLSKAKEQLETCGDEEMAYVYYMRYIDVRKAISKSSDYAKDRLYYDSMLSKKDFVAAIDACEMIQKSLESRYHEAAMKKTAQMPPPPPSTNSGLSKVTQNFQSLKISSNGSNGVKNEDPEIGEIIDPNFFYKNLIQSKSTSFFVLDVRKSSDFKSSRLKHSHVINVPEEVLEGGITADGIEKKLNIEDKSQWRRRFNVDVLIMMDWESESIQASNKLKILKDAMFRWDHQNKDKYKSGPHLLKGGFYNFVLHYPMEVVNPDKARGYTRNSSTGVKNALAGIQDLEYPDLDAAFIATPGSTPSTSLTSLTSASAQPTTVTTTTTTATPSSFDSHSGTNSSSSLSSTSKSSLYPSDLSDLNKAFLSGAITVKREPSASPREQTPQPAAMQPPAVPDRSSKPSSSADTVRTLLAAADQPPSQPVIPDRSLKARILLKTNAASSATAADTQMKIIEAESDLVDESLDIERQKNELEDRWTKLRLRREKEAEEEMKQELMRKEEQLLEEMAKLETDNQAKDLENATLRKEMAKMKTLLDEQTKGREILEAREVERRVQLDIKKRERERMEAEVRAKREARIKHQKQQQQVEERRSKLQQAEQKRQEVDRELAKKERHRRDNVERLPLRRSPLGGDEPSSGFGALNRSYSSPNIAKMVENEENEAPFQQPFFDRSSKPIIKPQQPVVLKSNNNANVANWERNIAKFRDFQGIEGSERTCLTGLKNLGNTCYMNSILQCLANFPILSLYMTNREFLLRDLNQTSKSGGNVAIEFASVLKMLTRGQYNSISPTDFKAVIGKYYRDFRTYEQQDAHELLNKMIGWLHDDLNEVADADKIKTPEQKNEGVDERIAAETAWQVESTVGKSFIKETFYGQWRSVLTCPCGWTSVKYESFFELALQLPPGNGKSTLRNCIESFLKPEDDVPYKCPKCQRERNMTKKFEIVRLPHILIIQLVRFYNDGLSRKRQNTVDFEENVNLGIYATACGGNLNRYDNYRLYSVCNHMGSMEGGHYTAYCYSDHRRGRRQWHKYDDHEVYEIDQREVKSAKAYILFYQAVQ